MAKMGAGDWDGGIAALPPDPGVYSAAVQYYRALAHLEAGRPKEALEAARRYEEDCRWFAPLLDDAIYLEIRARKALSRQGLADPDLQAAAERAKKDLEPTNRYEALLKLLSS
jgi:hypothetical protein